MKPRVTFGVRDAAEEFALFVLGILGGGLVAALGSGWVRSFGVLVAGVCAGMLAMALHVLAEDARGGRA